MSNAESREIKISTLVRSKPFRAGVEDYHRGVWSTAWETKGWRTFEAQDFYEQGRLTAAATGHRFPGVREYIKAQTLGAIPPISKAA